SRAVIGTTFSSVIDMNTLDVVPRQNATTVRLSAWFDNEWGYTNRVRDIVKMVGRHILTRK
ncbi:hypothetical protein KC957_03625, partial [Candidatus Saccharibacteria bacterium]|nr:hypothetical protein [Candidatus Saccharibacteria bacterium]